MNIVFFFLDSIVFFAIVVTLVSIATAALVLFLGVSIPWPSLRTILILIAFVISLIISSVLAYDVVIASIPSGRWLNLLIMILLAPVLMPIVWSAMKYTRRELDTE